METIGERIAAARKNAKLTQEELAQKVGLGKTTILNFEKNLTNANCVQMLKISEVLRVDIGYLVTGAAGRKNDVYIPVPPHVYKGFLLARAELEAALKMKMASEHGDECGEEVEQLFRAVTDRLAPTP